MFIYQKNWKDQHKLKVAKKILQAYEGFHIHERLILELWS